MGLFYVLCVSFIIAFIPALITQSKLESNRIDWFLELFTNTFIVGVMVFVVFFSFYVAGMVFAGMPS